MLIPFNNFFVRRTPWQIITITLLLAILVSIVDFESGYELSFSIFYVIPITIGAWYSGKRAGLVLSLFSAALWLTADLTSGHYYTHPAIPYWNALVRLSFFIITALLTATLKKHLQIEKELSRKDELTGLLNRRAFKEDANILFALSARNGRPISLGYIDIDNFKMINDIHGHDEGDRVLKTVTETFRSALRKTDLASRLGGDEFAVLLPDTSITAARVIVSKIQERLLATVKDHNWPIGFSIGVAVFSTLPETPDEAMKQADALMYRVKNSGKNNVLYQELPDHP